MSIDFLRDGIFELSDLLKSKKISPAELTREYQRRAAKYNPSLTAFLPQDVSEVTEQGLRGAHSDSVLNGIPAAIKDNICVKDTKTTCGSHMLEDFVPPYDATAIEKLKKNGYVLLGKTAMDEFAMGGATQTSALGKTKNPFDTARVPGGSSGGSAAAVAAGLAPYALGSDTGGSVRQPASFCGVTGLKPTYGRVSRYGLIAFGSSLDQIGPIAKSARECAVVLQAIAGRDEHDATSSKEPVFDYNSKDMFGSDNNSVSGLRIGLPDEFFGEGVSDEMKTAVMNAAHFYEKHGAVLVKCHMKALPLAVQAYYLLSSAEAASNLSRFDGVKYGLAGIGNTYEERVVDSRNRGFGTEVKRRILLGNYALASGYYDAYYRKARAIKQRIIAEYNQIFESCDVILTPTATGIAPKIGENADHPAEVYAADICTVTASIAGLPSVSTPCGYGAGNMPLGMALTGKPFDEGGILKAADFFEQSFDRKVPEIFK